jgi:hypothetical protein
MKLSNINKPTTAQMTKLGVALSAVSAFISASSFSNGNPTLGYVALTLGVVGVFLTSIASPKAKQ